MTEYPGQPRYVVNSFRKDVFEPWAELAPHQEWGRYIRALWELADAVCAESDETDEARIKTVLEWFESELTRAFDNDWWGELEEDEHLPRAIEAARAGLNTIISDWRGQASQFRGEAELEAAIESLPTWAKSTSDTPPLSRPEDDPEWPEFVRLRSKFMPS